MIAKSANYTDTVKYLYGLQKYGIKLGLSTINELMNLLGQPHKSFRSIHIAGTNGKGSTATALASILTENGFKVGLFTSPHLVSFTERIRINNQLIPESDVIDLASKIRNLIKVSTLNPTFFEFVTAMAFYYFSVNAVEWAVIETGMGGRLDATNVIKPDVAIITNISRDHSEFLGDSIKDITFEKAGIIKSDVPVITAAGTHQIKVIAKIAKSMGSAIHVYGRDFGGDLVHMNEKNLIFNYTGYENYRDITTSVTGKHQIRNISMAIRACEVLRIKGIAIADSSLREGLRNMNLEGRFEFVSDNPSIILDGAHNPEASKLLSATIRKLFSDRKIILIVGVMNDKDIKNILDPLIKVANYLILTKAEYDRAASPSKLMEIVSSALKDHSHSGPESIIGTDSVSEAIRIAMTLYKKDSVIIVTGSFYTAGEAREVLGHKGVLTGLRE